MFCFGVECNFVNHVILVSKDIIQRNEVLDLQRLKANVRKEKETEFRIAERNGTLVKCHDKWDVWC